MYSGRVAFGAMEEVVSGRPAADAVVEKIDRFGAARVLLIVSGTLNRKTSEIDNAIKKMTPWIPRSPCNADGPAQLREILLAA